MGTVLSRREWMGRVCAVGVGLVVAGCHRRPMPRTSAGPYVTGSGAAGHAAVPVDIQVEQLPPAVQAAARRALPSEIPGVSIGTAMLPSSSVKWWVVTVPPFPVEPVAIDLGPALREVNFNPAPILLPGLDTAFSGMQTQSQRNTIQVMPLGLRPLLVRYDASVFRAAGTALPHPSWTLAEFEHACEALGAALAAGRLDALHIKSVLYPQLAYGFADDTLAGVTMSTSTLLWEAFITGFGGTVVNGTRVAWETGAAFTGLSKLMEIFRLYGSSQPFVSNATRQRASPGGGIRQQLEQTRTLAAMEFVIPDQLLPPAHGALQVPGLAPFPRMPVRSVTPMTAVGCELLYGLPHVVGSTPPTDLADDEVAAAVAAVRCCEWIYQGPQQMLFVAGGIAPVTSAASSISPFWRAYGVGGPGVDILLRYHWPSRTAATMLGGGQAVMAAVLQNPDGLKVALQTLSQSVSNSLATQASGNH